MGPFVSQATSYPTPEGRYLFMLLVFQLAWDLGRHWVWTSFA